MPAVVDEILAVAHTRRWAVEPGAGSAKNARRARRRPRILVVSPPTVLQKISGVVDALFDAGVEPVFSGKRLETMRFSEGILANPQATLAELPLAREGQCPGRGDRPRRR